MAKATHEELNKYLQILRMVLQKLDWSDKPSSFIQNYPIHRA